MEYFAYNEIDRGMPWIILDWDVVQIEGAKQRALSPMGRAGTAKLIDFAEEVVRP